MTDKDLGDLGVAAGDIISEAFHLGYETCRNQLIPAGGMALTAEQVEDVRALVWLDGRRNFDAFHRLRALFPATEPAEPCSRGVCSADDGHDGTCAEASGWAEPAEEETKAETRPPLLTPNQIRDANPGKHETFIFGQQRADGTACVGCSWQTYEVLDTIHAVAEHDDAKGLVHDHAVWITKNGICPCGQPASSPVVPAPTETGPWQRIEDVPEGVFVVASGAVYVGGPVWRTSGLRDGVNRSAPFFASVEEQS